MGQIEDKFNLIYHVFSTRFMILHFENILDLIPVTPMAYLRHGYRNLLIVNLIPWTS